MSGSSERRRYPRFDIELGGRISGGTAADSACVIRDFCQGGLLVQCLPPAAGEGPSADPAATVAASAS